MKKILLFLLFATPLFAQIKAEFILPDNVEIVYENQELHRFFERQLKIIDTVDGNTWVCVPEKVKFKKGDHLIIIEGVIVAYKKNGKQVVVQEPDTDMVQYDFKQKKKLKIKNGSLSSTYRYPKDVKQKIEKKLKKVK